MNGKLAAIHEFLYSNRVLEKGVLSIVVPRFLDVPAFSIESER
jgi:hypothetical protein